MDDLPGPSFVDFDFDSEITVLPDPSFFNINYDFDDITFDSDNIEPMQTDDTVTTADITSTRPPSQTDAERQRGRCWERVGSKRRS